MAPDRAQDPLDRLLDQWQVGPPSPDLANRIVAKSREVAQLEEQRGWAARLAALLGAGGMGARLAPQLVGLSLALLVGFWYGADSSTAQEFDASPLILGQNLDTEWPE